MRGLGVRAVRLLYTDLHGVARGKDIPIGHFVGMCEEGVAFCAAVMGTDLRHTPVVGGEEGYVDFAIRPDLDTLRVGAVAAGGRLVPRRGVDARRLRPLARPARGRSCSGSSTRTPSAGSFPIVAPELEFFLAERDAEAPNGLRRYVDELSRVYTVGAVSDPREIVLKMLLWCDELGLQAFAANHEFMNSQYEINVKHSAARRRRRPGVHAQGGREGDRRARGHARHVHGPPIRRPGRLGLPRPPLARTTPSGQQRLRRRGRARRPEPSRGQLHRGPDRARAGAPGAPRADDQRVQADPPRQPRADARELGPRQPHGVLPRPERARLAGPGRDAHRRRRGVPAPDDRRAPARRARRDRARARRRPSRSSATPTGWTTPTPGSTLPADLGSALDALEADTVLVEADRRRARLDLRRDEAIRGRAVRRGRRRARRRGRDRVGDRGICCPISSPERALRPRRGRRRGALGPAASATGSSLVDGRPDPRGDRRTISRPSSRRRSSPSTSRTGAACEEYDGAARRPSRRTSSSRRRR